LCGVERVHRERLLNTIQRLSIHEARQTLCHITDAIAVINLGGDTILETTIFDFSRVVAPVSAMRVIPRQMEITEIILPIALIFPDGSHEPVALARRFGDAGLDARSRARTLKPINT
jgi:hypothetical protein